MDFQIEIQVRGLDEGVAKQLFADLAERVGATVDDDPERFYLAAVRRPVDALVKEAPDGE